jgi:putative ABC transport system permease protein
MNWRERVRDALGEVIDSPDESVVEELAQHAEMTHETALAQGCSSEEAERRVAAQIETWQRAAPGLRPTARRAGPIDPPPTEAPSVLRGVSQDARYAFRMLRRHTRFTLVAVLTMALGIGATTVLFAVTYGVLLKPLPWPHADRVVVLKETRAGRAPRFGEFTSTAYLAWREKAKTVEDVAAWSSGTATLAVAGESERVRITSSSASLFTVLGLHPLIGSLFEAQQEGSRVVVLSEGLWRHRFGSDPKVLGTAVRINGQPRTIVGVLPDEYAFPDRLSQAWIPLEIRPSAGDYLSLFNALALLRPGVGAARAAAEGTARGRFAADTRMTTVAIFGGDGPIAVSAVPLRDAIAAGVRRPLLVLLVAVALLLGTATANVASLQLARATTRKREVAVRAALGADGARLARQLLVESLLLGLAGGGAGLFLASAAQHLLPSILPADFPRLEDLGIGAPVVLFAVLLSVGTSVLFGSLPALHARRVNFVDALAENGTASVGVAARSWSARLRLLIMTAQVAVACVLLVGASLLGRSFAALVKADRGYDPSGVMSATVRLPDWLYSAERRYAVLGEILARLSDMPGVERVAFTSELPVTPGGSTASFTLRSRSLENGRTSAQASPRIVSNRYFSTIGMRILEGRVFGDSDTSASPPVIVVNRTFARRYLGDSPLGARLPMGAGYGPDGREAAVVGVVDDVRYVTTAEPTPPEMYFAYQQMGGQMKVPAVTFLLRSHGDMASLASAVRLAITGADTNLVADPVMRMDDQVMLGLAQPRLYALLLGGFAALALVIAAVGLFSVLSYLVAQRSREFGLRTALGARPVDIVRLVVRQGLWATISGAAAGLVAAVALTRSLSALLYGVTPYDELTFVAVPLGLVLVAAAACAAPARRAARLDPLRALKS